MTPKESDYLNIAYQRAIEQKTHVSFPQLKYPSMRDEGFKDPVQWLVGKAIDDGAENLWRVHDGLYDLHKFIDKHPGGAEWLELTKGTDITEAFETHHLKNTAQKILQKYYVRNAQTPRNSPFTFKEDGFYKTLKVKVCQEIEKIPKSVAKKSDHIIDGLFSACLMASTLSLWVKDYWLSMAFYLIASCSAAWVNVAAHNYIHRKSNWRMYFFNIIMWSYRDFRISHVLSHHLFANTLMDLEVSAFEPFIFWNPRQNQPLLANFAFITENITFPFLMIITFSKKFLLNFIRKGYFKNHCRWHDFIGFLLPAWMYVTSGASFYDSIIMWLWINCTASFIFFTIASNAAHHHPKIFKDGDEVRDITPDWGMHELEAVMDRTDINDSHFKVMTFFGHHSLHHLFPTLDHAILELLYPVFIKHCEKHRANFRLTSQLDLFLGQIRMTVKKEPSLWGERGLIYT